MEINNLVKLQNKLEQVKAISSYYMTFLMTILMFRIVQMLEDKSKRKRLLKI